MDAESGKPALSLDMTVEMKYSANSKIALYVYNTYTIVISNDLLKSYSVKRWSIGLLNIHFFLNSWLYPYLEK